MGMKKPVAMPQPVKLSHNPPDPPDADPSDVYIGMDDQVRWDYSGNFVVVFEKETPFDSFYFFPGKNLSSTPRSDVKHNHPYKYSVHIGGKRRDPNVIIRP